MLSIKGQCKNTSGGKMTSLFDGIAKMLGGLVKLTGAHAPRYHTGGIVSGESLKMLAERRSHHLVPRGHVIFQGNPRFGGRMEDDLAQRRNAEKIFHITVNPPQTRKRPITGDMTQMCQDLGIEPSLSYADFSAQLQKVIADSMRLPSHLVAGHRWLS